MTTPPGPSITVVAHEVRADGGMERAMMETLVGLLERGWRVRLFARVCEIEGYPGLRWIPVPTPRRPAAVAIPLFAMMAGLLILLSRPRVHTLISLGAVVPNRVDVVTVQFCQAGFAERATTSRASRSGSMWRLHDLVSQYLALALERWCYRPGRLTGMTAVSELVKKELQTHFELESVPIDVIPNGVDLRRFRPDAQARQRERQRLDVGPDELLAVFVGGDWRRKGLEIAIDAAAKADWTLLVVGQGDSYEWAAVARAHGARVHFCGHVANPESRLCAGDAFILPSDYEGFALVTVEAAATGLPLLVTKATGAAALVESAGGAALAPDADAFAAELRRLGGDATLRSDLGMRARAAAEEFAWPGIVRAYARAYSL